MTKFILTIAPLNWCGSNDEDLFQFIGSKEECLTKAASLGLNMEFIGGNWTASNGAQEAGLTLASDWE
jgi:hypothetical protein